MGEQNAQNSHTACSPFDANRPKNKDPNRNPETLVVLSADEQREITIMDCPETTILMRLRQFQREHLFNLGDDLKDKTHESYVRSVWWAFNDVNGNMPHKAGEKSVGNIKAEKELSAIWAKVDRKNHLCPGHFFHTSENKHDSTDIYRYKVDGSYIPDSDRKLIRKGRPNWAYVSFLIEFKRGGIEFDPFDDSPGSDPDATAKTRRAVRGQIMSYAERVFAYQHRTAVFMLFVNGNMFRVLRWDRSGVIVTEAVNYVRTFAGCRALLQVTLALSKLSRAQQGLDTTAVHLLKDSCGWKRMGQLAKPSPFDIDHAERTLDKDAKIHQYFVDPEFAATFGALCSDGECQLHRDPTERCRTHRSPPATVPVFTFIRELFRKSLQPGLPRYRLTVGGRDYLVGQHIFLGFGLVGRGTRGYVALDWETQKFVFLKDSWRPYLVGVEQEGAILSKLNQHDVINVPTVLGYGDVYDVEGEDQEILQETVTSRYHPVRGTLKVDWDELPFAKTIELEMATVEDMMQWVILGTEEIPKKDTGAQRPDTDGSHAQLQRTSSKVTLDKKPSESAPTPSPAFPPGPPKPAGPSHENESEPRGTKRTADVMEAEDKRLQGGGLRHMAHTRMVEKEICLPFTAFTSSRQLVRVIFDCVNAHATAYLRCQYMHRDVSAGNLLIYPCLVVNELDGSVDVHWQGLLADWELAKHSSKTTALQPQRTGTWHFMSAYLLSHPGSPTAIADELESFAHILIYGAVRRVDSDLQAIHDFIRAYFAGCDVNPLTQKVCCPSAKRESVVIGQTLAMSAEPITFRIRDNPTAKHPLNTLISELLKIFHSRYVVNKWRRYVGLGPADVPAGMGPDPPSNPALDDPLSRSWLAGYKSAPECPPEEVEESAEEDEPPQQPTPAMYANVAALETHKKVLDLFFTYAYSKKKVFPAHDVVKDRLEEPDPASQPKAAASTESDGAADASDLDGAKDASAGSADAGPSQQTNASAPADGPSSSAPHVATKTEPVPAVVPPASRPMKKRRKDPVLSAEAATTAAPTGRMTRSRAAAMLVQAAAAVPQAPPAPQPPPVSQAPPSRTLPPQALPQPPQQEAPLAQTTMRVTRSKSGKLPVAPRRRACPAPIEATASKRGATRSSAVARAAGGGGTSRRGGAAARSTEVGTRGRRNRRA